MPPRARATKATTPVVLSEEIATLVDRAVRAARSNGWCEQFSQIAGPVFGIPANEVVDSDGFNCEGYDREGYDAKGFHRDTNLDREGYNTYGRDKDGRNREGFDQYGVNKEGLTADGRDQYRFDSDGYDIEGYAMNGQRSAANCDWYAKQAARPAEEFNYNSRWTTRPKTTHTKRT
jgi:hypothetical protein